MKQPKPTWKQRCLAAEKERDKLGEIGTRALTDNQQLRTELSARPTVEKIVEKEPWWFAGTLGIVVMAWIITGIIQAFQIANLMEPVPKPYPVYAYLHRPTAAETLYQEKLGICQDAWREDEREIRKLRKELHADH